MVGEEPKEAHVLTDWCNDIVGMMPPQTKRSKNGFCEGDPRPSMRFLSGM